MERSGTIQGERNGQVFTDVAFFRCASKGEGLQQRAGCGTRQQEALSYQQEAPMDFTALPSLQCSHRKTVWESVSEGSSNLKLPKGRVGSRTDELGNGKLAEWHRQLEISVFLLLFECFPGSSGGELSFSCCPTQRIKSGY